MTYGHAEAVDEAAAVWMARLRAGTIGEQTQRELREWLQADPGNGDRLAHYESLWLSLEELRSEPRMLAFREADAQVHSRRQLAIAAAAATLLVLGASAGTWIAGLWPTTVMKRPPIVSRLANGVGPNTRLTLQDGSKVVLDTNSAVETEFTPEHRSIHILRGRVFFQVAHDRSRPFIVNTDKVAVTATGTQFSVTIDDGRDTVRMMEGSVVATSLEGDTTVQLPLAAGKSLDVAPGGRWTVMSSDNRDLDWINGRLTFRNARLAEIAAEVNRYSSTKIVFADARTADGRLNAVLKVGDIDTFLSSVQQMGLAKVKARTDELVVLDRPS